MYTLLNIILYGIMLIILRNLFIIILLIRILYSVIFFFFWAHQIKSQDQGMCTDFVLNILVCYYSCNFQLIARLFRDEYIPRFSYTALLFSIGPDTGGGRLEIKNRTTKRMISKKKFNTLFVPSITECNLLLTCDRSTMNYETNCLLNGRFFQLKHLRKHKEIRWEFWVEVKKISVSCRSRCEYNCFVSVAYFVYIRNNSFLSKKSFFFFFFKETWL